MTWFEEPVSSDDLAGLAQIRAAVAPEVTAGEYGYTLGHVGHLLGAGAVDCLQADVTRCGGITVWLRAAALAEAAGRELSGHCAPHVHAHVAAAIPDLVFSSGDVGVAGARIRGRLYRCFLGTCLAEPRAGSRANELGHGGLESATAQVRAVIWVAVGRLPRRRARPGSAALTSCFQGVDR